MSDGKSLIIYGHVTTFRMLVTYFWSRNRTKQYSFRKSHTENDKKRVIFMGWIVSLNGTGWPRTPQPRVNFSGRRFRCCDIPGGQKLVIVFLALCTWQEVLVWKSEKKQKKTKLFFTGTGLRCRRPLTSLAHRWNKRPLRWKHSSLEHSYSQNANKLNVKINCVVSVHKSNIGENEILVA